MIAAWQRDVNSTVSACVLDMNLIAYAPEENLPVKKIRFVSWSAPVGLLVVCALMNGCFSTEHLLQQAQQQRAEAQQRFTTMMNKMVGEASYEQVLTRWGPPMERKETAGEIRGLWEDTSSSGGVFINPEHNPSRQTGYHNWRVWLSFDRRSQRLKAWKEETR